MARDLYLVLGLDREANADEIKRAYRRLVKQFHPDTYADSDKDSHGRIDSSRFCEVSEAYRVLSDPVKKADYDRVFDESRKARDKGPEFRHDVASRDGASSLGLKDSPGTSASNGDFHLEVLLTTHEALHGVVLPLRLPLATACERCDGMGCGVCAGSGIAEQYADIMLSIPGGTQQGIYRLRLDGVGRTGTKYGIGLVIHLGLGYNSDH